MKIADFGLARLQRQVSGEMTSQLTPHGAEAMLMLMPFHGAKPLPPTNLPSVLLAP